MFQIIKLAEFELDLQVFKMPKLSSLYIFSASIAFNKRFEVLLLE